MYEKVTVYKNLNRGDWSVKQGTLPVRHVKAITLANVTFRVQQAARAKVAAGGHRSVHAYADGIECKPIPDFNGVSITYSPKAGRAAAFTTVEGHHPIAGALFVEFRAVGYPIAFGITYKE